MFAELAIIQGVLLAMLVVLSVLWAFCCRRLRRGVSISIC